MALSHRFGLVQGPAGMDDDLTSGHHEFLQRFFERSSLFKCSVPLVNTFGIGDKDTLDDAEEELIDPIWKVEFQAIMRKCKLKQTISFNRNLALEGIVGEDIDYSFRGNQSEQCLNGEQILEDKLLGDPGSVSPLNKTSTNALVNQCKKSITENVDTEQIVKGSSVDKTDDNNILITEKKMMISAESDVSSCLRNTESIVEDKSNNKSVYKVPALKQHVGIKSPVDDGEKDVMKVTTAEKNKDKTKSMMVNKGMIEPMKDVPVIGEHSESEESKDNIVKKHVNKSNHKSHKQKETLQSANHKENILSKCPTHKNKAAKCSKNVMKVIPATSFPLDELLPQEPIKKKLTVTSHVIEKKKDQHKVELNAHNTYVSPYLNESYMTDCPNTVFHGEVYTSPYSDDLESKYSNEISPVISEPYNLNSYQKPTSSLNDIQDTPPCDSNTQTSNSSLERFSFLMDAIHDGNVSFVEHLQNALSQQIGINRASQEERDDGHVDDQATFEKCAMPNSDRKRTYGFYDELNSSTVSRSEKLQNIHDCYQHRVKSKKECISEKGDNVDRQSEELFELFIQQCSQLVKTNEDEKMLSSLVHLLKKESGSDMYDTKLNPACPIDKSELLPRERTDSLTEFRTSDNYPSLELFEGRTLLKGGVHPRHIPKSNTIQSGKDKPKDPRPISTMLAKTIPKPLPLPRFIRDLWDDSTVQRILTLDWDSKRVHFADEMVESDRIGKDTKIISPYNPSQDLHMVSKTGICHTEGNSNKIEANLIDKDIEARRNIHTSVGSLDRTPTKDELKNSNCDDEQQNDGRVYGKMKKSEVLDSSLKSKDQIDSTNTTMKDSVHSYNKIVKRGLKPDLVNNDNDDNEDQRRLLHVSSQPRCKSMSSGKTAHSSETNNGTLNKSPSLETSTGSGKFSVTKVSPIVSIKVNDSQTVVCPVVKMKGTDQVKIKKHNESAKAADSSTRKTDKPKDGDKAIKDKNKNSGVNRRIDCSPRHQSNRDNFKGAKDTKHHDTKHHDTKHHRKGTSKAKLPRLSDTLKETTRIGIVKPMPYIVISDHEDENRIGRTSEKITPKLKSAKSPSIKKVSSDSFVKETDKTLKNSAPKSKITDSRQNQKPDKVEDKKLEKVTPKSKNAQSTPVKKVSPDIFEKIKNFKDKVLSPVQHRPELEAGELEENSNARENVTKMIAASIYSDVSDNDNIPNDKKRKHLAISVGLCSSDLEEGQIVSDSGSDLDGKRTKNERESENLIKISLIRSRQYRERKRNNSCSSVESDDYMDDQDKKPKNRHKSSSSMSTKINVHRSSTGYSDSKCTHDLGKQKTMCYESQSSVEESNAARSLSSSKQIDSHSSNTGVLLGSRKRHHTVHNERQSPVEKSKELNCQLNSRRNNTDSHKESRKRHHTVHDEKQSSVEKKSRTEPGLKYSYYDDILSPEESSADLLSPTHDSLSDDVLSEEYRRLFGKSSRPARTKQKVVSNAKGTVLGVTSNSVLPHENIPKKVLLEDQAFLEQFKQKVQHKERSGVSCALKKGTLSWQQELVDRKFLESCKKKQEERAKQSVEDIVGSKLRKDV